MDSFRFLSERVFSIILAENDTVLLAAGDLTAICMWPLRSKDSSQPPVSVPRTLVGHTDAVTCLAVGPDPHMLLSGSRDGTVRAWNLQMEREQWRSPVLPSPVTSLAVSPDGRYALCGYDDGALRLWRLLAHARERQAFQGHEGPITSVTFTPDGKRAVSTSEDKTVRVWDVASGRELGRSSEHSAAIVTAAVSPGGSFVLCGGADGHLFLRFLPPPD
jgi:WD40 repeat protein